jgi:flagellar motility protein MotE (MotC chaperone)
MMKLVLLGLVGLLSCVATIVASLYFTGNLSQEKIRGLWDKEALAEVHAKEKAEEESKAPTLGTLAQQLKEREKEIETRKVALDEREKQLTQREADLDKARTDLETLQASINESYGVAADDKKEQIKTIAITLENMEAEGAAKTLESMPTDEAAEILMGVKEKKRGEILGAMSAETTARILKEMRDTRSGTPRPPKSVAE